VVGDGPLDLVLIPGFVSNVEEYSHAPTWQRIFERLTSFSRLIVWDKRGTGLSDPVGRVPTLDERADDLEAVLEASGSHRAALLGLSEGGALALLFAATRPGRVSALVLYGTSPKFSASPDWPFGWQPSESEAFLADIDERWGDGALFELFAPSLNGNAIAKEQWGQYQRKGASPAMARAVLEAGRD
jgi:pimeloyl-ACP methyl ester carboxylesterase